MTIIGIGSDIVEIKRISKIIERFGNRFVKRILRISECYYYYNHSKPQYFLAKRFAAKEAAVKAFGIGMCKGLSFKHFEVQNDLLGKPRILFFGQAKIFAISLGVRRVHITLTDERYYACAIVILED